MSLGLLTSSLRTVKNLKDVQYDKIMGMVSARISDDDEDYSHIKKRKSKLQLVLLSCAVCGIEFCYAAETAFVSPTLLKIGVPVVYMTLIWCLSPTLGFFLVPLLGSLSDRCSSWLGRRRPFILLLSLGIIIGLALVANGQSIGVLLGDVYTYYNTSSVSLSEDNETVTPLDQLVLSPTTEEMFTDKYSNYTDMFMNATDDSDVEPSNQVHPWSILFTVLGVVMLDFSCDSCQSPCRSYLLDVTVPADHSPGLSTFTVMAGLGGFFGYLLGGFNWEATILGASIGGHIKVVFTMVLVIYIFCATLTMISIKEVPLHKLGLTKEDLQRHKKKTKAGKYAKFTNEDSPTDSDVDWSFPDYGTTKSPVMQNGIHLEPTRTATNNVHTTDTTHTDACRQESQCETSIPLPSEVPLSTYLKSIVRMPKSLAIICLTNLFCWMSLVCYSLYFTDFVGQAVFGGNPQSDHGSFAYRLYEAGVRHGSFGMSLYSISCSIYSLCIEKLVSKLGAKSVYIGSQLIYTVGAVLMAITRHPITVILLSPCAGIMYATLFTMPYILVAHYHSNQTFEEPLSSETQQKQVRGLGTDVAIISSMVFLAQLLLSLCMGALIQATGTTATVMVLAGILSFCGAITATQIVYLGL